VGNVEGLISIYDMGPPGKERFIKLVAELHGKPNSRLLKWREQGQEIIEAGQDGIVSFWHVKDGNPLYVMQAHTDAITQTWWDEDKQ
jgi:WD40 repeat protein